MIHAVFGYRSAGCTQPAYSDGGGSDTTVQNRTLCDFALWAGLAVRVSLTSSAGAHALRDVLHRYRPTRALSGPPAWQGGFGLDTRQIRRTVIVALWGLTCTVAPSDAAIYRADVMDGALIGAAVLQQRLELTAVRSLGPFAFFVEAFEDFVALPTAGPRRSAAPTAAAGEERRPLVVSVSNSDGDYPVRRSAFAEIPVVFVGVDSRSF